MRERPGLHSYCTCRPCPYHHGRHGLRGPYANGPSSIFSWSSGGAGSEQDAMSSILLLVLVSAMTTELKLDRKDLQKWNILMPLALRRCSSRYIYAYKSLRPRVFDGNDLFMYPERGQVSLIEQVMKCGVSRMWRSQIWLKLRVSIFKTTSIVATIKIKNNIIIC